MQRTPQSPGSPDAPAVRADAAIMALLASIGFFLHASVLKAYWLFEELHILRHVHEHHVGDYFLVPAVWQEISTANLYPWLAASLGIDLALFGLEPRPHYLHHLGALLLVIVLLYLTLRLWLNRWFAFLGCALFLLSVPTAAVSQMLMVRHYLEGAVFGLASLLTYVMSLRRRSSGAALLSGLLYFFACSAKEIYVPLPLLALILPEDAWKRRVRYAMPLLVAFAAYIAWRTWMLGGPVGGYGMVPELRVLSPHTARLLAENLAESLRMTVGASSPLSVTALLLSLVTTLSCLSAAAKLSLQRRFTALFFFGVFFVCIYAPIYPVFNRFFVDDFQSYRFVFLVSLFWAVLLSFSLAYLSDARNGIDATAPSARHQGASLPKASKPAVRLIALASLMAVAWSSQTCMATFREVLIRPLSAEGRFMMESPPGNLLIKSSIEPANNYYEHLEYFRLILRNEESPLVACSPYVYVEEPGAGGLGGMKVFGFDREAKAVTEMTGAFLDRRSRHLARISPLPFMVELQVSNGGLSFSLGPHDEGTYRALTGYKPGVYCGCFPVPRLFDTKFYTSLKTYIRFVWESPDGRIVVSPEWLLDFSRDRVVRWRQ